LNTDLRNKKFFWLVQRNYSSPIDGHQPQPALTNAKLQYSMVKRCL
jgi:hypothetical protein